MTKTTTVSSLIKQMKKVNKKLKKIKKRNKDAFLSAKDEKDRRKNFKKESKHIYNEENPKTSSMVTGSKEEVGPSAYLSFHLPFSSECLFQFHEAMSEFLEEAAQFCLHPASNPETQSNHFQIMWKRMKDFPISDHDKFTIFSAASKRHKEIARFYISQMSGSYEENGAFYDERSTTS